MRSFASGFFHESVSPQHQSFPLRPFQNFLKNRGDIRKSRCTTGVNDTGGKFATGVNDTGGKLPPVSTTPAANLPPVLLVLLIPVANLPPVSTIPAANLPICQRHRWQTKGLISGCRYLKVNLKAKMYICVNSTTQRCPNKN